MDNKKLYKRLSTLFWFTLATLPIWVALIGFIGQYIGGIPDSQFISNPLDVTYQNFYRGFNYYLESSINSFIDYTPSFINELFENLWNAIDNIRYNDDEILYTFIYYISWFSWVFILQLLVDVFIWLPKFIHNGLEKWGA